MKTTDEAGRPLSATEIGDKLAHRSHVLRAVASDIREEKNPSVYDVGALAHATIALVEDIEDVQKALWDLGSTEAGGARKRKPPELFQKNVDRLTLKDVLNLLLEYTHGYHAPVGSEDWNVEVFETMDVSAYDIEDLEWMRERIDEAIAAKRKEAAA